jgi:hypothetical protein
MGIVDGVFVVTSNHHHAENEWIDDEDSCGESDDRKDEMRENDHVYFYYNPRDDRASYAHSPVSIVETSSRTVSRPIPIPTPKETMRHGTPIH